MVDNSTQSKSGDGQKATIADVMALKNKVKRLEEDNIRLKETLKLVDLDDVSDQDLKNVKQMLVNQHTELESLKKALEDREDQISARESVLKERDKTDLIQSLTSRFAPKGEDKKAIEAFSKAISESDDPEKEALKLYAERMDKEEEGKTSAEDVFESKPAGGKVAKSPLDMTPEELKQFEKEHAVKI